MRWIDVGKSKCPRGKERHNIQQSVVFLSSSISRTNRKKGGLTSRKRGLNRRGFISPSQPESSWNRFRPVPADLLGSGAYQEEPLRLASERERSDEDTRRILRRLASCQPHVVWPLRHMTRCGPSFIRNCKQPPLFLSFSHPHEGFRTSVELPTVPPEWALGWARGVVLANAKRSESYSTSHHPLVNLNRINQ